MKLLPLRGQLRRSVGPILALAVAASAASAQGTTDVNRRVVAHPDDSSKHVEYFELDPPGTGPWPTIVMLHGYQDSPSEGGRVFVETGMLAAAAKRGLVAVGVSVPGFGGSSGPDDFAGPFAVHGVEAVVRALRASGRVRSDAIVLQGVSLGAMTVGMLAAEDSTLAGVVMISGEYDPPAELRHPRSATAWGLIARAWLRVGGPQALQRRSVLSVAPRIKVPALIINGSADDRTDPAHAQRLAAAIDSAGGHARFVLVPGFGHQIPPRVRGPIVDPFIDSLVGARAPARASERKTGPAAKAKPVR